MIEKSELIVGNTYSLILVDSGDDRTEEAVFMGIKSGYSAFELTKNKEKVFMNSNIDVFNSKEEAETELRAIIASVSSRDKSSQVENLSGFRIW